MLGWLLWCCLVVSMYRQRVPSPRDHHSTSWGHESCRRHNIDMSFPHHFLPPPMLLQDTLKQWWLPMIGLRITPWPDCILNYTDHQLTLVRNQFLFCWILLLLDTLHNIEAHSYCFIGLDNSSHLSQPGSCGAHWFKFRLDPENWCWRWLYFTMKLIGAAISNGELRLSEYVCSLSIVN